MSRVQTIAVTADEADLRLDRWFKRRFPELGHGRLEKLLRTGQVRVEGRRVRSNTRLEPGQQVRVPPLGETGAAPPGKRPPAAIPEHEARTLRAAVLYRDDDVLAINKPAGLAVQGGTGLGVISMPCSTPCSSMRRSGRGWSIGSIAIPAGPATGSGTSGPRRNCPGLPPQGLPGRCIGRGRGVPKRASGRIDLALSKLPGRAGGAWRRTRRARWPSPTYRVLDHAGKRAAWRDCGR
jgi:23S rRNA pseudouridine955/2504/2580 synthase